MQDIEKPTSGNLEQSKTPESLVVGIKKVYPSILFITLLIVGAYFIIYTSLEDRADSVGSRSIIIPGNGQLEFKLDIEYVRLNSERGLKVHGPTSFFMGGSPRTYPLGNGINEWNRPHYFFYLRSNSYMRLEGIVYGPNNLSWRSPLSDVSSFSFYVTVPELSHQSDSIYIKLLPDGNYSIVITNLEPKEVNATIIVEEKLAQYSRPYFWYGLFILIIALGYPMLVLIARWKYRGA